MAADDIEVIHMTAVEWDQALTRSLNDLGLTWEQLTAQARDRDFESLEARKLWLMAGGQGPNQASTEVERLRADVRAAYAERDEMWERKAAALRERDEARRELERLRAELAVVKRNWTYLSESLAKARKEIAGRTEHAAELRGERDALKATVQRLAAEAHRRKWAHEHSSLTTFNELHRIGNELKAALDTPTTRTETA